MSKPAIIVYDNDTRENIDDLADVVITSVADNDALRYDTSTSKWINQIVSETRKETVDTSETVTISSGYQLVIEDTFTIDGILNIDGNFYLN